MDIDDEQLRDVVVRMRRHRRREMIARWGGVSITVALTVIGLTIWFGAVSSGPRSSPVAYLIFFASCAVGVGFYQVFEPKRAFEEDEDEPELSAQPTPSPESSVVPSAGVLDTVARMTDPLDFEHAAFEGEPAPSESACALCTTRLDRDYWTAGGAMLCARCAEQVRVGPPKAGAFLRVLKAGAFGIAFGLVGTIVYGAVLALTDINLALLTILIGWLVGLGVRRGAEGRGGLGYQLFAAALTYVLCMEAWMPMLFQQLTTGEDPLPPIGAAILASIVSLALPFFGDMSLIGFLILGFGMWRAFRALAAQPIAVDGPFVLAPPPADDAGDEDEQGAAPTRDAAAGDAASAPMS